MMHHRSLTSFVAASLLAALALSVPGMALDAQVAEETSPILRAAQARVQPGDRLAVKVFREPQLSDAVMVDARGDVALPRIGVLHVADYGILELQDTLRARLGAFLRNPSVEVVVLRRIVVNGEVLKSGVYYVDIGTATLRDAIALAGGITPYGHSGRVSIVRDGERIPVPDWQSSERSVADLRSGDQVVVGRRSWAALNSGQLLTGIGILSSVIISIVTLSR